MNAHLLLGFLLGLVLFLLLSGLLGSLLLLLHLNLSLGIFGDWNLILEGIIKLLGGHFVGPGEEVLNLRAGLLEVLLAHRWSGHLVARDGLSSVERFQSLIGVIIIVKLGTSEDLTSDVWSTVVLDLEEDLTNWSLWVEPNTILKLEESSRLWHVLVSGTENSSLVHHEVVSLESHLALLVSNGGLILGRDSLELGAMSFLSLGDGVKSLLLISIISEEVVIISESDSGSIIDKGHDGEGACEFHYYFIIIIIQLILI